MNNRSTIVLPNILMAQKVFYNSKVNKSREYNNDKNQRLLSDKDILKSHTPAIIDQL